MLSVLEAAGRLGVSPWTIRDWIKRRKIGCVHLGRRVLIEESTIQAVIDRGRQSSLSFRERRRREQRGKASGGQRKGAGP